MKVVVVEREARLAGSKSDRVCGMETSGCNVQSALKSNSLSLKTNEKSATRVRRFYLFSVD